MELKNLAIGYNTEEVRNQWQLKLCFSIANSNWL